MTTFRRALSRTVYHWLYPENFIQKHRHRGEDIFWPEYTSPIENHNRSSGDHGGLPDKGKGKGNETFSPFEKSEEEKDIHIRSVFVNMALHNLGISITLESYYLYVGWDCLPIITVVAIFMVLQALLLLFHRLELIQPNTAVTGSIYLVLIATVAATGVTGGTESPFAIPPVGFFQFSVIYGGSELATKVSGLYLATFMCMAAVEQAGALPQSVFRNPSSVTFVRLIYMTVTMASFLEESSWNQMMWWQKSNKLEVLAKSAEQASSHKSNFLAVMSHEIAGGDLYFKATSLSKMRTPLNHVMIIVELLEQELRPFISANECTHPSWYAEEWKVRRAIIEIGGCCDQKVDHSDRNNGSLRACGNLLNTLKSSAQMLLDVIDDVLDLSKIESGKQELDLQPHDLAQLVTGIVDAFKANAQSKAVDLVTSWNIEGSPVLVLDKISVHKILVNLLGNALKFTAKGSVTVNVSINDTTATVAVTDTGVGISPDEMGKLFQPFSQADDARTTRKFGGSGLGLVIARNLARLMHGDLVAHSQKGVGSRFTFTLPTNLRCPADDTAKKAASNETSSFENTTLRVRGAGQSGSSSRGTCARHSYLRTASMAVVGVNEANERLLDDDMPDAESVPLLHPAETSVDLHLEACEPDGNCRHSASRQHPGLTSGQNVSEAAAPMGDSDRRPLAQPSNTHYSNLVECRRVSSNPVMGTGRHAPRPRQTPRSPINQSLAGIRILVIDDNELNLKLLKKLLQGCGAIVTTCVDGPSAVDMVGNNAKGTFNVILLDICMPGMDGYDVAKAFRQIESSRGWAPHPIIAITAMTLTDDMERSFASGMNHFLSKPINRTSLEKVVLKAMTGQPNSCLSGRGAADNTDAGATVIQT